MTVPCVPATSAWCWTSDGHRGQRQGRGWRTAHGRSTRQKLQGGCPGADAHLATGWRPYYRHLPPGGLAGDAAHLDGPGLDLHDNLPASQNVVDAIDGTGLPLRPGPGTDVAVRPAARVAQEPDALRRRGAHISSGFWASVRNRHRVPSARDIPRYYERCRSTEPRRKGRTTMTTTTEITVSR